MQNGTGATAQSVSQVCLQLYIYMYIYILYMHIHIYHAFKLNAIQYRFLASPTGFEVCHTIRSIQIILYNICIYNIW